MKVRITDAAFAYLVNQRGEFFHLAQDRERWAEAYYCEMQKTILQVGHAAQHMLDLGSGLGVIDALMMTGYGTRCVLVDGEDGKNVVKAHGEAWGNRQAVEQFMFENNINRDMWSYYNPDQLHGQMPFVFDLVISLRSWCFHYPPKIYTQFVREHAVPGCRILVDVRKGMGWRYELAQVWEELFVLEREEKYERILYAVRGRTQ